MPDSIQTDLFGLDGSVPASRRTDPETSKIAERKLRESGKLSLQRRQALEAVRRFPGKTAPELAKATGLDRYMLSRRLAEIRTLGDVFNPQVKRMCRVTGSASMVWHPMRMR